MPIAKKVKVWEMATQMASLMYFRLSVIVPELDFTPALQAASYWPAPNYCTTSKVRVACVVDLPPSLIHFLCKFKLHEADSREMLAKVVVISILFMEAAKCLIASRFRLKC